MCQRHPTQNSIACLMISLLLRLHSPLRLRALLSAAAEPLLDALGDSYAAGCEGSCFYALQSCMNHSCDPNTHAYKRAGVDTDGSAIILAKRAIEAGEEICISYIEESEPHHVRQSALEDYGFVCSCSRCTADLASAGKTKV